MTTGIYLNAIDAAKRDALDAMDPPFGSADDTVI